MNNKAVIVATVLVLAAQACSTFLILANGQRRSDPVFADHIQRLTFDGNEFQVYLGRTIRQKDRPNRHETAVELILPKETAATLHMQMGRMLVTKGPLQAT